MITVTRRRVRALRRAFNEVTVMAARLWSRLPGNRTPLRYVSPPQVLETARLILRPPRMDDGTAIFQRYQTDLEVTRYLMWRPVSSIDQTRRFLRQRRAAWKTGETFAYALTLRGDDSVIGMIEIRVREHSASLGYVLAKAYWNNGYMTEAVQAATDWALDQPSIYRVWAVCDVENPASARVLEKAGFHREGILRRWLVHPNLSAEPRDCYCYSIVK
jgi:RimJ/RimL family protein N-acetyltransferase